MSVPTSTSNQSAMSADDAGWIKWARCQHCRLFIAPDYPAFGWYACKNKGHGSCYACLTEHMYYCRECGKHKDFEHNWVMARFASYLPLDLPCPRCHVRVFIADLVPGGSHADCLNFPSTVAAGKDTSSAAYAATKSWRADEDTV